jgi:hypothetical protein
MDADALFRGDCRLIVIPAGMYFYNDSGIFRLILYIYFNFVSYSYRIGAGNAVYLKIPFIRALCH